MSCLPEVSTEPASFRTGRKQPIHQATCECGWKGRRRKEWHAACDEADAHAASTQQIRGER